MPPGTRPQASRTGVCAAGSRVPPGFGVGAGRYADGTSRDVVRGEPVTRVWLPCSASLAWDIEPVGVREASPLKSVAPGPLSVIGLHAQQGAVAVFPFAALVSIYMHWLKLCS